MSDTMQTPPTPASVFHAYFGAPPGAQDSRADCEKWERLCGELLAERARLRDELERARFVEFCKSFQALTPEELEAQIAGATPFEEIIASLKEELRSQP
jgi:hypothetical protein